jgi:hypothetical protein
MYSQHFLLMNRSNKLECYTTLSWKGLAVTNTLDYWVCYKFTKEMNCCEDGSGGLFKTFHFLHNVIAYYDKELITAVSSFKVQAPETR